MERYAGGGLKRDTFKIIDFELAANLFLDKFMYMSQKSARNFKERENDLFLLTISGCQK